MADEIREGKRQQMKIFTSSWFEPLPANIHKIGISRGVPRRQPAGYRLLKDLAPGPWFNSVSPEEYHCRYMAQLAALDAHLILGRIAEMGGGRDVALLCYEKPADPEAWCHRGQVAGWLWDRFTIEVYEFGLEEQGPAGSTPSCCRSSGGD